MKRLYSYGNQTYKLQRGRQWRVFRWDRLTYGWQLVDLADSKREARRSAARDAYSRSLNP